MKIYYMGVFRNESRPALQLCAEKDLSGFGRFVRHDAGTLFTIFSRDVAERMENGKRKRVENEDHPQYIMYSYCRDGVAGVIVTDDAYPDMVALRLSGKIVDEFLAQYPRTAFSDPSLRENACPLPQLKDYIVTYQDPSQADSIMKIQQNLQETLEELQKSMEKVVLRGGALDEIAGKSDQLSVQAKAFYGQAKKQNSCCVVM